MPVKSVPDVSEAIRTYRNSVIFSQLQQAHPIPITTRWLAWILGLHPQDTDNWMSRNGKGVWRRHPSVDRWMLAERPDAEEPRAAR